jgi:hypothetical protein
MSANTEKEIQKAANVIADMANRVPGRSFVTLHKEHSNVNLGKARTLPTKIKKVILALVDS